MAKQGMTHPDVTRGPRNETSPVPQIQGKAKSGKVKANPIIAGTTGASQKVWHEKPISKAHGIIDTDLVAFCGDQRPVVRSTSGRYFKGILASMVKAKAGAYAPH